MFITFYFLERPDPCEINTFCIFQDFLYFPLQEGMNISNWKSVTCQKIWTPSTGCLLFQTSTTTSLGHLATPLSTVQRGYGISEGFRSSHCLPSEAYFQKFWEYLQKGGLKEPQTIPKSVLGAAKRPREGILLSLAFLKQPFCIYSENFWTGLRMQTTSEKPLYLRIVNNGFA